ncbi:MAG: hypothetical protein VX346_23625 [Planctomycetota bacterium]|nr:hypothetical protein [Planctomycetota bacterium]
MMCSRIVEQCQAGPGARLCCLTLALFLTPHWAGGAENLALVVNGDSWMSRSVANHYISLREIPAAHVVQLTGLPDLERIDVERFRRQILRPVLNTLRQRQRLAQIDYLVYSSDLPYIIDASHDLVAHKPSESFTPVASVNGLTFFYQQVLRADVGYLTGYPNRYFRRLLPPVGDGPLPDQERKQWASALELIHRRQWQMALTQIAQLIDRHPQNATLHFTRAGCQAQLDQFQPALESLDKAIDFGWYNYRIAAHHHTLLPLHKVRGFQSRLQRMAQLPWPMQASSGFRAASHWNEAGVASQHAGPKYLLSTVLGITSGRGNSLREIVHYLQRSRHADGSFPAGTVYFPVNSDPRSKLREDLYGPAIEALQTQQVKGQLLQGVIPQNRRDVVGLSTGTAFFKWRQSGSGILAGAICEHFTSSGGILLEAAHQTPLTEFLRWGAAGSSGAVHEPYTVAEKFPSPFVHVHYTRGCTLGEAYYQSVASPYQLLIVGDPLCRPWARIPQFELNGLPAGGTLQNQQEWSPHSNTATDNPTAIRDFTLYIDGHRHAVHPSGQPFHLDPNSLADGHHQVTVVATADNRLASRGRRSYPVTVRSRGRQVELRCNQHSARFDEQLQFEMRAAGARSISMFHDFQPLATVNGAAGVVTIGAHRLGLGPVRLWAVARYDDSQIGRAFSPPLLLTVRPPQPIAALAPAPTATEPGVLVTVDPGRRQVVTYPLRHANWIESLNLPEGARFSVEAYFDVTRKSLFQLQLQSNCQARLFLNHQLQPALQARSGIWRLAPVVLEPGTHRLILTGRVAHRPRLRFRMGNAGTRSLDGQRFWHLRP